MASDNGPPPRVARTSGENGARPRLAQPSAHARRHPSPASLHQIRLILSRPRPGDAARAEFPDRPTMPRAAAFCLVVALLVLSEAVAATAAPLPQKVFVTRGNGYCRAYYVKLNRLPIPQTLARLGPWLRAERPYVVTLGEQLAKLVPPLLKRARYTAMLASLHAEFPVADRVAAAAIRGDGALVQSLMPKLLTMDRHYDALANSVGLTICGKPSSR